MKEERRGEATRAKSGPRWEKRRVMSHSRTRVTGLTPLGRINAPWINKGILALRELIPGNIRSARSIER